LIQGEFEKPLILALKQYYNNLKYRTHLHAQLNISWSNIISDVDVLAIRKKEIIAIEVKSKRDIFANAFYQLDKIAPYVDKCFIATDNEILANKFRNMESDYGIIYIDLIYHQIIIKKRARLCDHKYSSKELSSLRKCCLQELAREWKIAPFQSKSYLALDLVRSVESTSLRKRMKELVVQWKCVHSHPGLENNIK
jgi:hypothetical protein